jgi:hypothetical protein
MKSVFVLLVVALLGAATLFVTFQTAELIDQGPQGERAWDFLKGTFSRIVFEIDYFTLQPEIVPDKQEVERFLTFAKTYTGKSVSAVYQELPLDLATTDLWDDAELRALSAKTRDMHSWPFGTLTVHIIYANALYAPNGKVAGIALSATLIVIFKSIARILGAEDIVLAHEFGHLMGLCGIVQPSDLCDGSHAKNPASLMAANIDTRYSNVADLKLFPEEVELLANL